MFRRFLELVSRGVALKRRLPVEFGGMWLIVSPDASLKYWGRDLGKIDPKLLGAAKKLVRPGDVVWDIGANVGLFGFASAGLSGPRGQVLAVEPDPWLAALLRKSVSLNGKIGRKVEVLQAAVGAELSIARLNIARRGRATSFISGHTPSSQTGGVRDTVSAFSISLDWLLAQRPAPAVVKIDVEGSEVSVLEGASKLLQTVRPKILCEVSANTAAQVTEILVAARYALFDADGDVPIQKCAWNTIALPMENARE